MTNSVQSAVLGRVPISFIFECQQTNERARMDGEDLSFHPSLFLGPCYAQEWNVWNAIGQDGIIPTRALRH